MRLQGEEAGEPLARRRSCAAECAASLCCEAELRAVCCGAELPRSTTMNAKTTRADRGRAVPPNFADIPRGQAALSSRAAE